MHTLMNTLVPNIPALLLSWNVPAVFCSVEISILQCMKPVRHPIAMHHNFPLLVTVIWQELICQKGDSMNKW